MREFKFRVWSIEEKQFISPNILEVFDESGDLTPFKYIKTGKLNPLYMPVENYIIQQYTGLTDSNDNPIYEGDIINLKFGELNANLVVKWDKYMGLKYHNGGWTSLVHVETHGEVIGNIFEHPELLN